MNKKILIIAIIIILVISLFFIIISLFSREDGLENNSLSEFIQCLADADVVIYGSKTCSVCASLVNSLGGYEVVDLIYVDCNDEWNRCSSEMQTNYVPEIQIKGELYSGSITPSGIRDAANCEI